MTTPTYSVAGQVLRPPRAKPRRPGSDCTVSSGGGAPEPTYSLSSVLQGLK